MKQIVTHSDPNLPSDIIQLNQKLRDNQTIFRNRQAADATASPRALAAEAGSDAADPEVSDGHLPASFPLECWDVQAYAYSKGRAAKVGLLAGLFGGDVDKVEAGVIHEAKRYSLVETGERPVEVGVAVRLSVATASLDAKAELTLPHLAAAAQLHNHDTRVGISVTGYIGSLGEHLPSPSKLDVETCIEYMNAFKKIQGIVFSDDELELVLPTILSYEAEAPSLGSEGARVHEADDVSDDDDDES